MKDFSVTTNMAAERLPNIGFLTLSFFLFLQVYSKDEMPRENKNSKIRCKDVMENWL